MPPKRMPKRDPKTGKFVKARKKSKASISMCGCNKKRASSVSTLTENDELLAKALIGIFRASPLKLKQIVDALPAVKDDVDPSVNSFFLELGKRFVNGAKSTVGVGFTESMKKGSSFSGSVAEGAQSANNAAKPIKTGNKVLKSIKKAKVTSDANRKNRELAKSFNSRLPSRVVSPRGKQQMVGRAQSSRSRVPTQYSLS